MLMLAGDPHPPFPPQGLVGERRRDEKYGILSPKGEGGGSRTALSVPSTPSYSKKSREKSEADYRPIQARGRGSQSPKKPHGERSADCLRSRRRQYVIKRRHPGVRS